MGFVGGIAGGRHFRLIFNMFMTIFLVVLLANWMELVPGVDTIGFMHRARTKEKYDPVRRTNTRWSLPMASRSIRVSWASRMSTRNVTGSVPADEAAADEAALVSCRSGKVGCTAEDLNWK